MSLQESLVLFSESLAGTTSAPDRYASPFMTYEINKERVLRFWGEARPKIKRDLERAQQIDQRLTEMFAAFESGEVEKGRDIAWELWGSNVKKLR